MKKKKYGLMILLALFCCILFSASAQAAGAKNKFVKASNGNVYYYNAQGKKAKGLVTVNGKKYYFASNGVQRTGWRCVKKKYYFFRQAGGAGGYMKKSTKVNGIRLKKNGTASYNKQQLRKLKLMVLASSEVDRCTNNKMTKAQKLKAAFRRAVSYGYGADTKFYSGSDWDIHYGEIMLYRKKADCFGFGAAFAYLANAVGYKAYAVSSGGHGWAEVNGRVYDPDWAKVTGKIKLYGGMNYNVTGPGIPRYKDNRLYVKKI